MSVVFVRSQFIFASIATLLAATAYAQVSGAAVNKLSSDDAMCIEIANRYADTIDAEIMFGDRNAPGAMSVEQLKTYKEAARKKSTDWYNAKKPPPERMRAAADNVMAHDWETTKAAMAACEKRLSGKASTPLPKPAAPEKSVAAKPNAATSRSAKKPEPWKCVAVARNDVKYGEAMLKFLKAGTLGSAQEDAFTRRSRLEEEKNIARGRARMAHWFSDLTITEQQFNEVTGQSMADIDALGKSCETAYGVPGSGPPVLYNSKGKNTSVAKPAAFKIHPGIDHFGNDLGMVEVPVNDVATCRKVCEANGQCRAFNLYTPPPKTKSYCWIKHTAGPSRPDPNSVSGTR